MAKSNPKKHPPSIIDHADSLPPLVAAIEQAEVVGLDTEFQREGRLAPELCLLQLAVPGHPFVAVDPLAGLDLSPLFDALQEKRVVLHDARQDIEVIAYLDQPIPREIFDTQIAYGFLHCTDGRPGYAKVVEAVLGEEVSRDQSMSDWSRRPLKPAQLRYALEDVQHLLPLYQRLHDELEAAGRLSWALEGSAAIRTVAIESAQPSAAWTRVSGAKSLKGRGLSVLSALAQWREGLAIERRTLPKRVMPDSILVALAKAAPVTEEALRDIRLVQRWVSDGHGPDLLAASQAGAHADPSTWPRWPKQAHLAGDPRLTGIALILDGCLKSMCRGQGISPWLVGTRADVEEMARRWLARRGGATGGALTEGWRGEAFGDALTALLSGQLALRVDLSTASGISFVKPR